MGGIIFDIKKYAIHDGPGIRTTIFFKGCPLSCLWCHNPESRNLQPEIVHGLGGNKNIRWLKNDGKVGKEVEAELIVSEIEKDILFFDQSGGGVTFSGGEPLLQVEFLSVLLKKCKQKDINTAVDTCGHVPFTSFERIMDFTDLFLFDLKIMDEKAHLDYTGVSNKLIHKNLIQLSRTGKEIIIRIPLIPGITDTEENIDAILTFTEKLTNISKIDLLPYNILSEEKYRKITGQAKIAGKKIQSPEKLDQLSYLFKTSGYDVTIGG